jgi:hypothetical protein
MKFLPDLPMDPISGEAVQPVPIAKTGREEHASIDYAELPEDKAGDLVARDWNYYCRQAGRLLADGHEGKWVLIKDERIVGIWDTRDAAENVAAERYLMQSVLIHQVLRREPILRGPTQFRPCRS